MTWPTYPSVRPSGVDWLGDVPSNWSIERMSWLFDDISSGTTPESGNTEYYGDEINWVTTGELREQSIGRTARRLTRSALASHSALKLYPKGTLLIAMYGATIGRLGWLDEPASTNQACCAFSNPGRVDSRFAYYALYAARDHLVVLASGGGQPNINQEKLRSLRIGLPSTQEQVEIVAFLDRETAKIDALINKQEQLISTLREDRTATITHAVTKGLDPEAEMRDSGVESFGQIPREWSVRPFLRCVEGRVDYRGATPKKVDDGVLLITARNVRPGWIDYTISAEYVSAEDYGQIMRRGLPEVDDLLFTMEAPLGNAALVDRTDVALAQRIIKFRPDPLAVTPKFLLYAVIAESFQAQLVVRATGSTALGLKASKLPELQVVVPDIDTQNHIVGFLDAQGSKINSLITKASQVIETLREYRSALITAAVTGKIDVRGAA